jgi:hypothetical protein
LSDTVLLDRYHEQARAWLPTATRSRSHGRAAIGGTGCTLTPTELRRLGERIEALFAEYGPRNADPARRPRGTRPVSVITLGYPEPDLEPDPDAESESEPSAADETATEQPS